jgi:hypothetical protein
MHKAPRILFKKLRQKLAVRHGSYGKLGLEFWIDALCIDQSNVSERNHQVAQMSQIYSNAWRVISWLGMQAGVQLSWKVWLKKCKKTWRVAEGAVAVREVAEAALDVRSYWERAWIIQEVVLARKAFILVGDLLCSSDELDTVYQNESTALSLYNMRRAMQSDGNAGAKPGLLDLLTRFGAAGCSNRRDRVYSILGLAKEGDRIEVDYQLSDLWVAYHTLAACQSRFCICTVLFVTTRVFELHQGLPGDKYEEGPYLEFTVAEARLEDFVGECSYLAFLMRQMVEMRQGIKSKGWSSFVSTGGRSWEFSVDVVGLILVRIAFFAIPFSFKERLVKRQCPQGRSNEPSTSVRVGMGPWNISSIQLPLNWRDEFVNGPRHRDRSWLKDRAGNVRGFKMVC